MSTELERLHAKQYDQPALKEAAAAWRSTGESLVFTNGCFDLLHKGHIHYLSHAADLGDKLIIGVNSDASVTRLKGAQRPLQDQAARTLILAALQMTAGVVVFEADTPYQLIRMLSPDVLVKGGDYRTDQIVGADHVRSYGGTVHCIPFLEGHSTSHLARKLSQR